jgi:hypothetical protein
MDTDLGNGMDGTEAASRILGTWFGDLLPPDQVELFRERFPPFRFRGHIENVDLRLLRSDGHDTGRASLSLHVQAAAHHRTGYSVLT